MNNDRTMLAVGIIIGCLSAAFMIWVILLLLR
jgi:hypothetical protein